MIVEWVWAAYDLQVRLLTPWAELSRGTAPEKVWKLDYFGWNYFVGLWYAVKNLHLAVLLCFLGVWLAALAGVASTSLWTIQIQSTTPSTNLMLTSHLNPNSLFWEVNNTQSSDASYITPFLGHIVFDLARSPWCDIIGRTDEGVLRQP
ncbi:hypothetical protein BKA93DRAFT_824396 [Sparassis latifolia]